MTWQVATRQVVAIRVRRLESPAVPSKHAGAPAREQDAAFEIAASRLGANLRRIREERGFSQEQISERAGCAVRHVQRIESGTVNVSLRLLTALAAAVDTDVGELLAAPEKPSKAERRTAANPSRRGKRKPT